jgi:hypothetical protein
MDCSQRAIVFEFDRKVPVSTFRYGFGNWAEIKDRMELEGARFS